jgi:hypothetical protein
MTASIGVSDLAVLDKNNFPLAGTARFSLE